MAYTMTASRISISEFPFCCPDSIWLISNLYMTIYPSDQLLQSAHISKTLAWVSPLLFLLVEHRVVQSPFAELSSSVSPLKHQFPPPNAVRLGYVPLANSCAWSLVILTHFHELVSVLVSWYLPKSKIPWRCESSRETVEMTQVPPQFHPVLCLLVWWEYTRFG